jgi:hypothetical protein
MPSPEIRTVLSLLSRHDLSDYKKILSLLEKSDFGESLAYGAIAREGRIPKAPPIGPYIRFKEARENNYSSRCDGSAELGARSGTDTSTTGSASASATTPFFTREDCEAPDIVAGQETVFQS